MRALLKYAFGILLGAVFLATAVVARPAAAAQGGEFALQISPSPLVANIDPGKKNVQEIKIRNNGSQPEVLKIEPRKFSIDNNSQNLKLDDTQPAEIANWISFDTPVFTIQPNQTSVVKMTVDAPKDAGFSYSLALIVSRTNDTHDLKTGQVLKGSVAIFTLLNVNRPDAKRELQLTKFRATSSVYDHLPVTFEVEFKNTGNTIVKPFGNVFIQRSANDSEPIDTLDVNPNDGYILPGKSRTLTIKWDNGFIVDRVTNEGGRQTSKLTWDWSKLGSFRFGPYTAKVVAVYNDGQRDVPLVAETSFWVIQWMLVIGAVAIIALVGIGLWTIIRKTVAKTTKTLNKPTHNRRFIP
jgi:archaellum component FlaF (FlaF/FlaG flagellin family)